MRKALILGITLMVGLNFLNAELPAVRIKDIAKVSGVRANQLMGVGLVVGLKSSGDSSLLFTNKALANLLANMGASAQKDYYKSKNVAAVMVTAELPPFMKSGQKLDVFVSSIGDAKSLKDGTLLMTPLKGADDKVYAVAQGPVILGGRVNLKMPKNETVGKVMEGAIVENTVPMEFIQNEKVVLVLNKSDFTTATRIAESLERGGYTGAKATDPLTVEIPASVEDQENIVSFISRIEEFLVIPDNVAKVVINQRTGTVVIGENVRLAPVAISHGELEIKINKDEETTLEEELAAETQYAGQNTGTEEETLASEGEKKTKEIKLIQLKAGASLSSLVQALNAVGTSPQDLVAIIQALKTAGSLAAEVEVI